MLKTIAVDKKGNILTDVSLERLKEQDIAWFWVDFDTPTRSEINLLTTFFKFHELLIEDCLTLLQRPKIEITRQQIFLVSHVLKNIDDDYETLNMFVGKNYIVTFHLSHIRYVNKIIPKILSNCSIYLSAFKLVAKILKSVISSINLDKSTLSKQSMWKLLPCVLRITFCPYKLVVPLPRIIQSKSNASAVLIIVPKFPGS